MNTRRRIATTVALATGAVLAVRTITKRNHLSDPVTPDLRTPLMHLIPPISSTARLRLIRSIPMPELPLTPGVEVRTEMIEAADTPDVRVLVFEKPDSRHDRGALVWIHGGGYVIGEPEQANVQCSKWAAELGLVVVSVDYRLAPEHPFPAGLEDCYTALQWVHDHAAKLGVDPTRIAVGGDSAGGGLAAGLAQIARDRGGPAVRFQLLEYPMLDDRTTFRTEHGDRGVFLWTPKSNLFGWTSYLGRAPAPDYAPRYAAPGRTEDLEGLPPAWIGVGDLDLFLPEDIIYAEALEAAGVPCQLDVIPGMYHGADSVAVTAPTSIAFREAMTTALARGLDL